MEEKVQKILSIVITIVIVVGAIIYKLPELKNIKGSSDNYIDVENYDSIVGININEKVEFLLVTNNQKITNLVFLTDSSLCLYNKNIEGKSIKEALSNILKILENKGYINDELILIMYPDNKDYDSIKELLTDKNLIEETSTYQDISRKYNLTNIYEDNKKQISYLDKYSKELIRIYNNDKLEEKVANRMTDEEALEAANRVYEKLTVYALDVENQDKDSNDLLIQNIPANQKLTIYPSEESWYYIKNYKVYAYIKFISLTKDYEFCYTGSIEKIKKGACS